MKKSGPVILNQAQICEVLRVSRPTIRKYEGQGCPVVSRGNYDAAAVVAWYVSYQCSLVQSTQDKAVTKKGSPEVRLLEARAIKIEMENQEKIKELIPIETVSGLFLWFSTLVANSFESLGARMANILAGMDEPAEIQAEIHREARQIRRLLTNKLQNANLKEIMGENVQSKDN